MCSINKTLLVRASGGLSNRLQAVISGIAYCLLTDRAICIDWRDGLYSDDFSNVFPLWFNIKGLKTINIEEVLAAFDNNATINPPFWKDWLHEPIAVEYLFNGNDHTLPKNKAMTSISLTDENLDEDILVFWDWHINSITPLIPKLRIKFSHLKNMNDTEIQKYLLKTYLHPTGNILNETMDFVTNSFFSAPVGIHIRHTDLQSPLPKLLDKLKEVAKEDEIFLCTDNEQVEKMVCRLFPRTITRDKIYQGLNIPLHSYVEGVSNVQKGHEAVLDMLILAQCKHIIHYKQSSFARISILFSELDCDCVHSVQ